MMNEDLRKNHYIILMNCLCLGDLNETQNTTLKRTLPVLYQDGFYNSETVEKPLLEVQASEQCRYSCILYN